MEYLYAYTQALLSVQTLLWEAALLDTVKYLHFDL